MANLFDDLEEIQEVELVEQNSIEQKSKFIKDSGAYVGKVTKFYFTQNDNGTTFFNYEFETKDGQILTHKEWFITKAGKVQFAETDYKTKEPTGKMKDFEGFAKLRVISRALTGDDMAWKKTEKKIIPIYNFDKKADIDTEVDMFVAVLGKNAEILVRQTLEDKTKLNTATGKYEAIAEVRTFMDVKSWLDPETHKTYTETESNLESVSYNKFMAKIEETPILDERKVSKNTDANAKPAPAAPSAEATNAFA